VLLFNHDEVGNKAKQKNTGRKIMKKIAIKTKNVEKWNRDELINVVERTVKIDGITVRIPEVGEFGSNGERISDLGNLQIQYSFSHGGVNPPQGTQSCTLVAGGTAKNSTDIGYNKSVGSRCRVVGNKLEIGA